MSIHPSLRGASTLIGERSVFTRMERIQILMRDGKFDPKASSIHGLPKVRTRTKVAKRKVAAKEEAAPAAAAAPEAKPAKKAGK